MSRRSASAPASLSAPAGGGISSSSTAAAHSGAECDIPRALSIVYYLTAVAILVSTGVILAGFFASKYEPNREGKDAHLQHV